MRLNNVHDKTYFSSAKKKIDKPDYRLGLFSAITIITYPKVLCRYRKTDIFNFHSINLSINQLPSEVT